MAVWKSFIDLMHLIGALGCLALTGGFAGDGEPARAIFYGLLTMAFAVALAHRRTRHPAGVIDLRDARTSAPGEVLRPR